MSRRMRKRKFIILRRLPLEVIPTLDTILHMYHEEKNGNIERAMKHYIISANLGFEESMQVLWKSYSAGHITKEELEATLRAHKVAIDATKSAQRDAVEAYYRQNEAASR